MGWFWGTSKNAAADNSTSDPLKDLDPSLRDFLEKESPVKYKPTPAPPSSESPILASSPTATTDNGEAPKRPVPTLFPDGRYLHLWSTYRPLKEIENETKTDQEKLADILEAYNDRKALIGRAALENCAMEQWAVNDCFQTGGWKSRMTMCRAENKGLERCYLMQSRFLKALGYFTSYDRPAIVDEEIQMHADKLYQRMLFQEHAIADAKAAGTPIPSFPPIMSSLKTPSTRPVTSSATSAEQPKAEEPPQLHPGLKEKFKDRFKGLTDEEKEIEERALAMEVQAGHKLGKQVGDMWDDQAKARNERREQGKATVSDRISGLFGW